MKLVMNVVSNYREKNLVLKIPNEARNDVWMKLWVVLVVIGCSVLGGTAQILLKKGSDNLSLAQIFSNYNLFAGVLLYGIAFIGYTAMLRFERVSLLYPLIALSYIWVVILAGIFLNEPVTMKKIIGAVAIVAGVYLIGNFE